MHTLPFQIQDDPRAHLREAMIPEYAAGAIRDFEENASQGFRCFGGVRLVAGRVCFGIASWPGL